MRVRTNSVSIGPALCLVSWSTLSISVCAIFVCANLGTCRKDWH